MKSLSKTEVFSIGLMMFSIFFGAGNLIFPPALGQAAGEALTPAIIGFLITGVGLPLMGVVAIAVKGGDYPRFISEHVHPMFAIGLLGVLYLAIGPLFAIPRTGAVSFEIGISPLLSAENMAVGQFVYTAFFFGLTYFLSLNPSKLISRIGKFLTPILLLFLVVLFVSAYAMPLSDVMEATGIYAESPLLQGFQDGYLTMDLLASLAVGAIVVNAVKAEGIEDYHAIGRICIAGGLIAVFLMSLVYVSLGYLGATSRGVMGLSANGGIILAQAAHIFFGPLGNALLAVIIGLACLTTSIGMSTACCGFFAERVSGRISYRNLILMSTIFSFAASNIGLTGLIKISVPFLIALYPVVIVLVVLTLLSEVVPFSNEVYRYSLGFTLAFSIFDGLNAANLQIAVINNLFMQYIPLYSLNLGWMCPAMLGALLGLIVTLIKGSGHMATDNN